MKFFDEEYASVYYLQEQEIIQVVWHRQPSEEEYRKTFYSAIAYVEKGNIFSRFMSDTRNQGVMSPAYRKWFEHEILPKAVEIGMKRAAVIIDANPFRRYYMNLLLSAVNKFSIPLKLVGSEEQAIEHLMAG